MFLKVGWLTSIRYQEQIMTSRKVAIACLIASLCALQGCTVLAVADVVGSVAVGTAGLAADAAIGTVRLGGKAVGAVADAALPDGEQKK
jgi:hypothetical protein